MSTAPRIEEITMAGYPGIKVGEQGDKPPIVVQHGGFADHDFFTSWPSVDLATSWPAVFAAHGYCSYIVSRRGRRGVQPIPPAGVTFDDYVQDAERVLGEIEGTPILLGHSLGGRVALKVAESHPCVAVVTACTAEGGRPTRRGLLTFLPQLPLILAGRPFLVSPRGLKRGVLNGIPPAQQDAVAACLVKESGLSFRKSMFGSLGHDPSKVTCPVLVVGASSDYIFPPRVVQAMAEKYGAEARFYDGFGHLMPANPDADGVAVEIVEWLESAERSSAARSDRSAQGSAAPEVPTRVRTS